MPLKLEEVGSDRVVASQVQHVSVTIVCGRVSSGTEALNVPQPDAMADASNVRHDTIVVPETAEPGPSKGAGAAEGSSSSRRRRHGRLFASPRITAGRR